MKNVNTLSRILNERVHYTWAKDINIGNSENFNDQ